MKHLIFYDGECPLCNRAVRFILAHDKKKKFLFAPLQGETAQAKLGQFFIKYPELDTLIFLENYKTPQEKILIEGKGALRVLWHLGLPYSILGILSYLPPVFNPIYRLIARYRFRLFSSRKAIREDLDQFLP